MKPNKRLIKEKGIGEEVVALIEKHTTILWCLLTRPELYGEPKNVAHRIEIQEYTLQALWGFDQDSRYHTYWNKVKGCTCAKMDNDDMVGSHYRSINGNCPFHGINEE